MNKRKILTFEKITIKRLALIIVFALCLTIAANGQSEKRGKWTYGFSETVKYLDIPLETCKSFFREKYLNDNYKTWGEAANDLEMYRSNADKPYIGVIYRRECDFDCNEQSVGSFYNSDMGQLKRRIRWLEI